MEKLNAREKEGVCVTGRGVKRQKGCPEFQITISLLVSLQGKKNNVVAEAKNKLLSENDFLVEKLLRISVILEQEQLAYFFFANLCLFFSIAPPGTGPDIHLPRHLPGKGSDSGGGLRGRDAGEVHGGREAEAET